MNKISNRAKIILFSLISTVFLAIMSFVIFLLVMYLGSYDRLNWNDMITNENIWSTNNKEIVFQLYEPDDYEWHSNNLESVFSYYGLNTREKFMIKMF